MKKIILKNGKEITIREAIPEDAEKIAQYKTIICGESEYLTFGKNEIEITPLKEQNEIEVISSKNNSMMAVALIDEQIVGSIVFRGGEKNRVKHVGEMGVTVRKPYWGLGIGSLLLQFLIQWAKESSVVRKINLKVRTDNENAIKLYKKYGFQKEGILKRDFYINENFYDAISMGLLID